MLLQRPDSPSMVTSGAGDDDEVAEEDPGSYSASLRAQKVSILTLILYCALMCSKGSLNMSTATTRKRLESIYPVGTHWYPPWKEKRIYTTPNGDMWGLDSLALTVWARTIVSVPIFLFIALYKLHRMRAKLQLKNHLSTPSSRLANAFNFHAMQSPLHHCPKTNHLIHSQCRRSPAQIHIQTQTRTHSLTVILIFIPCLYHHMAILRSRCPIHLLPVLLTCISLTSP